MTSTKTAMHTVDTWCGQYKPAKTDRKQVQLLRAYALNNMYILIAIIVRYLYIGRYLARTPL